MMISMLSGKIHRAKVTDTDVDYEGSITIDEKLMEMAGISQYQQVQVVNVTNGNRFETYAIPGKKASGTIQLNGGTAHLGKEDDVLIIMTYASVPAATAANWAPQTVLVDEKNRPIHSIDKDAESFLDARRRRKGAA
jgi:aspartate 1-decarboxylase